MAARFHQVESGDINNSNAAVLSPRVALFNPVEEDENVTLPTPVSPPSFNRRESYRLRELHGSKALKLSNQNNRNKGALAVPPTDNKNDAKGSKNNSKKPSPSKRSKSSAPAASPPIDPTPPPIEPITPPIKPVPTPIDSTIPEPPNQVGDDSPRPILWNDALKILTLEVSTLLRNPTTSLASVSSASSAARAEDVTGRNGRRNTLVDEDGVDKDGVDITGIITANDMLDHNNKINDAHNSIITNIHDTVLRMMLNVLCRPSYILIVSVSTINTNANEYVNFCETQTTQTTVPTELYGENSTVLTYNGMDIQDRNTALQSVHWLEWTMTYHVIKTSSNNVEEDLIEIENAINEQMIDIWKDNDTKNELLDCDEIIESSRIDNPGSVFHTKWEEYTKRTNSPVDENIDSTSDSDNVDIASIVFVPDVSDTGWGFFSTTRIVGFSLFFGIVSITYLLVHMASKRMEDNSWDAQFMGDLATEEGVGQMLSSGRENVMTSEKECQKIQDFNDSVGQINAPKRFNGGRRGLDTQSAL